MSRSTRRPSAVQTEKSSLPMSAESGSDETSGPPPTAAVPWYWRLVLFLWVTSFIFLFLYEWLAGILKAVRSPSG